MSQHASESASNKPHFRQINTAQLGSQAPSPSHGSRDGPESCSTGSCLHSSGCKRVLSGFTGAQPCPSELLRPHHHTPQTLATWILVMQAVSNLVDRTSGRAEQLGAELTRQLRHVSDNMAVQAEVSQGAFQAGSTA